MSTEFVVAAKNSPSIFRDNVQKDDAVEYSIDFSAWAEDNNDVDTATWTVESGEASVSGQTLSANVTSALITFNSQGLNVISIYAEGADQKRKTFLYVRVRDGAISVQDDYGLNS